MHESYLPGFAPERKIQETPEGLWISIRVTPGAKRAEIVGWKEGILRVKLVSPPEKGRANRELCELIADRLHVAKSRVTIESGETSRQKTLLIRNFEMQNLPEDLL